MNITLSADAATIQRTRKYAREHGTSANQLIRDFLNDLTEQDSREQAAAEFARNAFDHGGRSPKGFRFNREDAQRMRGGA